MAALRTGIFGGRAALRAKKLRRVFSFEYSDTGDNRRSGSVTLFGHRVEILHVRPNLYVIPQTNQIPDETQH